MSNPNIKQYASLGGSKRWQGVSPRERSLIAKRAVAARIKKYDQANKLDKNIEPIPDVEWKKKYIVAATFITSQGRDINEILEQAAYADEENYLE
jgi:hypothetical protein